MSSKIKKISKFFKKHWLPLLGLVFFLPFAITYFTHQYHFGTRIQYDTGYYPYLLEKYPDFARTSVKFQSKEGEVLEGSFFYQEEAKALIVWSHGMKVSYENYLGEIYALTEEGYVVFGYSNTGVNESGGDSLKGLSQAPFDLQSALYHLEEYPELAELPLILIGHSWGGFSVATAQQLDLPREVDGIITLAAFWRNINVIDDIASYYVGNVMSLLVPYLTVYEWFLFGADSQLNGIDGLAASTAPVLMIHSKDDVIVRYDNNFLYYQEAFAHDPRFTFSTYETAGHTLSLAQDSYDKIHDISHHQMGHEPDSPEFLALQEERLALIEDYNPEVMEEIFSFCQEIVDSHT